MENSEHVITFLSSIITPVVLVMASGSLILSTSQRLGREIDRIRKLSSQLKDLTSGEEDPNEEKEEILSLYRQLNRSARRVKHLQRAMTSLYLALLFFVTTSVGIGIVDILELPQTWPLIFFVLIGGFLLLYACIELISESRIAYLSVHFETKRAMKVVKTYFPFLQNDP